MKKIAKNILAVMFGVLLLNIFYITTPDRVYADPLCYSVVNGEIFLPSDCNSHSISFWTDGPRQGYCYETMSFGVEEHPLSSQRCSELANRAAQTAETGDTCYIYRGDDVTGHTSLRRLDPSLLGIAGCDNPDVNYRSGFCYVSLNNGRTLEVACGSLMSYVNLATSRAEREAENRVSEDRAAADCNAKEDDDCLNKNPLVRLTKTIINVLSALVGIVAVAVIIMGGMQYSSAGGNPNATSAAKKRITNAVLAVVAWIFLYALLNWLIPGGLFG